MRAEEPGLTPERDELAPKLLCRSMRCLSGIVLKRQDPFLDKALGALLQLKKFVGERKIHQ